MSILYTFATKVYSRPVGLPVHFPIESMQLHVLVSL